MSDSVTVVTLTRQRPVQLLRAVVSVVRQDFEGQLEHLILVDACDGTKDLLADDSVLPPNARWLWVPRRRSDRSGPARSAVLRNLGARIATTRWIAYLDDDNEWRSDHISSLISCARETGLRAVHSQREIRTSDGSPYLEPRNPWCRDPGHGAHLYRAGVAQGRFVPGSNLCLDRMDGPAQPEPLRCVDTGEWLLRRDLLLEAPWSESYSADDQRAVRTEDDKFMDELLRIGESVACTGRASLVYYLGGYSNDFTRPEAAW